MNIKKTKSAISATRDQGVWKGMVVNSVGQAT